MRLDPSYHVLGSVHKVGLGGMKSIAGPTVPGKTRVYLETSGSVLKSPISHVKLGFAT